MMEQREMSQKLSDQQPLTQLNLFSASPQNLNAAETAKIAVPFYKQVDEMLKHDVDFSSESDLDVIKRLLGQHDLSKKETQVLKKAFGDLKFFKETQDNLPENEYLSLLKELRSETYEQRETVFRYDDLGYKYYIILKGSVYVLVPDPDSQHHGNQHEKKPDDSTHSPLPISNMNTPLAQFSRKLQDSLILSKKLSEMSTNSNSSNINVSNKQSIDQVLKSPSRQSTLLQERRMSQFNPQSQLNLHQALKSLESINTATQKISDFFEGSSPIPHKSDNNSNNIDSSPHLISAGTQFFPNPASSLVQRRMSFNTNAAWNFKKLKDIIIKGPIEEEENNRNFNDTNQSPKPIEQSIKEQISQENIGFKIVKTLSVGDAFGEIALINNARRTASIICKEDTLMVTLSKQSYDKILSNLHSKKFMESVNFLKEFSLFSQWQNSQLTALYQNMETRFFKYKDYVFKEGETTGNVFFIKEGEFELSKTIRIEDEKSSEISIKHLRTYGQNSKNPDLLKVKMSVLAKGCSFGEEEIIMDTTRTCSVSCVSSQGCLLVLPKQRFLQLTKQNNDSLIKLKQDIENRVMWRENYQEKLIETEKNFRASINQQYFAEREPTLELADACQNIENPTGNLDLQAFSTASPEEISSLRSKRSSVIQGHRQSQQFLHHPIEQIVNMKEENARTIVNNKQSIPLINVIRSSPRNQDKPQISSSILPPSSPSRGGQRMSVNGHFISSLTDLELDFSKLTLQQANSSQIKNLIDPFYDPPEQQQQSHPLSAIRRKSRLDLAQNNSNSQLSSAPISQNITPTNKSSNKLSFITNHNKNKHKDFMTRRMTEETTKTAPDSMKSSVDASEFLSGSIEIPDALSLPKKTPSFFKQQPTDTNLSSQGDSTEESQKKHSIKEEIPKELQTLLKYTTQLSNVKNKKSIYDVRNFKSTQSNLFPNTSKVSYLPLSTANTENSSNSQEESNPMLIQSYKNQRCFSHASLFPHPSGKLQEGLLRFQNPPSAHSHTTSFTSIEVSNTNAYVNPANQHLFSEHLNTDFQGNSINQSSISQSYHNPNNKSDLNHNGLKIHSQRIESFQPSANSPYGLNINNINSFSNQKINIPKSASNKGHNLNLQNSQIVTQTSRSIAQADDKTHQFHYLSQSYLTNNNGPFLFPTATPNLSNSFNNNQSSGRSFLLHNPSKNTLNSPQKPHGLKLSPIHLETSVTTPYSPSNNHITIKTQQIPSKPMETTNSIISQQQTLISSPNNTIKRSFFLTKTHKQLNSTPQNSSKRITTNLINPIEIATSSKETNSLKF